LYSCAAVLNECLIGLVVLENVQCFGSSCFPVAFAIPAILMLIAIGSTLIFFDCLKYLVILMVNFNSAKTAKHEACSKA